MSREMHRPDGKLHITDPFTGLHSQTEIQSRKLKQFWSNVFFHRLLLEDQLTNTYNDLSDLPKLPNFVQITMDLVCYTYLHTNLTSP